MHSVVAIDRPTDHISYLCTHDTQNLHREDADASGGSSSSSEGDSSDDEAGAEEAEILEDLERAYALDGLKVSSCVCVYVNGLNFDCRDESVGWTHVVVSRRR